MSEKPPKIGTLINGPENRDAIHIAVAPVTADETLEPGQHIAFVTERDNEFVHAGLPGTTIGMVDPYLAGPVKKGDKFWMFLHPNTITSLRHNWTHPAFKNDNVRDQSQNWIKWYAISLGMSYEDLMKGAFSYLAHDEYLNRGPDLESVSLNSDFWDKFEIVTGMRVPEDHKSDFFSCSC